MLLRSILFLFLFISLQAAMVDGVAILVKNDPITLYEIHEEMMRSNLSKQEAIDALIRKTLEAQEIKERHISVSSSEVYDNIKTMAEQNSMNTSQLYDAMLRVRGLNADAFKAKIEENLLNKKLYDAIAFSKMARPDSSDEEEYYRLHIDEFSYSDTFTVVIYSSASQEKLQAKIANPMLYAPEVRSEPTTLQYEKLNPQLAALLSKTPINQFTPIVPAPGDVFMSFFVQEKSAKTTMPLDSVRNQVQGAIMNERRIAVLNDYFARLRLNADIKTIRLEKE